MDVDLEDAEYPRKLVVVFSGETHNHYGIPKLDKGNRQQLVHQSNLIKNPSVLVRFAARSGLTKRNKSMVDAVEGAYSFVSGNYEPGDQVMFVAGGYWECDLVDVVLASLYVYSDGIDTDLYLKAAKALAEHLHNGTRPGNHSESQSNSGSNIPPLQIPIYGIVVRAWYEARGMCEVNDELKSRFPPGIKHIISYTYEREYRSCASRFDMAGGIISREMCIAEDDHDLELRRHCTKHIIYYEKDWIPDWDNHSAVWTQEFDSSPSGAPDSLALALTKPVGMHRHELWSYQWLPGIPGYGTMLVWKSYRGAD